MDGEIQESTELPADRLATWINIPAGTHELRVTHDYFRLDNRYKKAQIYSSIVYPFYPDFEWMAVLDTFSKEEQLILQNSGRSGDSDDDNVSDIIEYLFDRNMLGQDPNPLAELIYSKASPNQKPTIRLNYTPINLTDSYSLLLEQSKDMLNWELVQDLASINLENIDDHIDILLENYDQDSPCFLRIRMITN